MTRKKCNGTIETRNRGEDHRRLENGRSSRRERQQEGENEKGKGQSKSTRRVVRREDVEEEEKEERKWISSWRRNI